MITSGFVLKMQSSARLLPQTNASILPAPPHQSGSAQKPWVTSRAKKKWREQQWGDSVNREIKQYLITSEPQNQKTKQNKKDDLKRI